MANDDGTFELSRRKALAGLGTIGVASAGAGLGTSAFFSDEENFTGNQLTAGSLDLKVDWEEHYSDWSEDEAQAVSDIVMIDQDADADGDGDVDNDDLRYQVPDGYVGLPDAEQPLIAIPEGDVSAFQDATSIEAYPDSDDDSIQDDLGNYNACVDFADTPEDLDPTTGLRTENNDTVLANGDPAPLVNLDDVKPGDFGELTLSFHLCDNPGYVWLQGGLESAAENGYTEPEASDPDETGDADDDGDDDRVELVDEIQTLLWYDEDGDNVYEPGGSGGEEVDVMLVLDDSGSMGGTKLQNAKTAAKDLVDSLNLGANAGQVGLVRFDSGVSMPQGLTTDGSAVTTAIDNLSAGGDTNIEEAVDYAHEELVPANDISANTPSGNARSSAQKIMVVLSDGEPNINGDGTDENDADFGAYDPADNATAAKNAGIEMFTVGFDVDQTTADLMREMASDPKSGHFFRSTVDELEEVFAQISQAVAGEECFWRGSLRDLLNELSSGLGIPLDGMRDTQYDELNDPPDADARDCFVASTNNFIGLAWYLPVDHANEIQTDSVSFDVGFYAEQCRHNDGSGQPSES